MSNLIIPESITIRLVKRPIDKLPLQNILFYVKTFARHKNDFRLGPFYSDKNGIVKITKTDFENEVQATYESGLMDYSSIENNFSLVEIRLYDRVEIHRMIESRTNHWKTLLKGEKNRWTSIEKLIETLKESNNDKLLINDSTRSIRTELDGTLNNFEFNLNIYPN